MGGQRSSARCKGSRRLPQVQGKAYFRVKVKTVRKRAGGPLLKGNAGCWKAEQVKKKSR